MKLKLISREFDAFAEAFRRHAAAFCAANPEVEIEHEYLEIHAHYDKMIAGEGAATDEYDLFLCVTDWLPEAMAKGLITPIDDQLTSDPPEGWPKAWSPSMLGGQTDAGGRVYGLPFHDGPEMLLYRKDLFEDPDEQTAYHARFGSELRVPETWDEFLRVAQHFTRPDQGLWGCSAASFPDGHNNVYDFLIHLWTRGGTLFDAEWTPRFNDEIGREALRFYADLYHTHGVISPKGLTMDSIACGFDFASGSAAMMWNWCGFAAVTEVPEYSNIVGKTKCAKVPRGTHGGHTSLNIYWVLTIPSGSKNKELAYQYLRFAASAELDKQTSLAGANGTRLSTWRDPEVQAIYQYYEIIEEVHRQVKSPPAIPEYPALNEVLSQMVDDVLHRRKSVEVALYDAARECEEILAAAGYREERA
jgi:multiple sugar transport system substrate-binding protein